MNQESLELQPVNLFYWKIQLTQGQSAIVDFIDWVWLRQWKWFARFDPKMGSFYASRQERIFRGYSGQRLINMHRAIMFAPQGMLIDHKDHNTINNSRSNLRYADSSQNGYNQKLSSRNTSGFKGVSREYGKWRATITVNCTSKNLGRFDRIEDAISAYQNAALKYYGEFARFS